MDTQHEAKAQPAYWSGVFAMTLCVFALIALALIPFGGGVIAAARSFSGLPDLPLA